MTVVDSFSGKKIRRFCESLKHPVQHLKPCCFAHQALRYVARLAEHVDREKEGLSDKLRRFPYALYFEVRLGNSLIATSLNHKRDFVLVRELPSSELDTPKGADLMP